MVVWPTGKQQLVRALSIWRTYGRNCPLCILGNGSNVLVSDYGFAGLVIITNHARRVEFAENLKEPDTCYVYAECGVSLTGLSVECGRDHALSGLEFACGIPGTVGGALVMNAGAFGREMEQVVVSADFFDLNTGETGYLCDHEMGFAYRHSIFLDNPNLIVLSMTLLLRYGSAPDIVEAMKFNINERRTKQPLEYPSAGSVFKRPDGYFVGKMVQDLNLKGTRIGGAEVSVKHGGFIINRIDIGGATARDVIELISLIQDSIYHHYNAVLQCEIRYISDGLHPGDGIPKLSARDS